jgi:hypothetical protein
MFCMNLMEYNVPYVLNISHKVNKMRKEWHNVTKLYFLVRRSVLSSSSTVRMKKPVLGIRDYWCGSVPLTNASGSNSFLQVTFRMQKKMFNIFSYNLPAGTLSSVLKIFC